MFAKTTAFALTMLCVSPALADWQYTKWGMIPNQVVAASKGAAKPVQGKPNTIGDTVEKLQAPYSTDDFNFTAGFYFDQSDKLGNVQLKLNNTDASTVYKLESAVMGQFGTPYFDSGNKGIARNRKFRGPGSDVAFTQIDEYVTITHTKPASGKGL